MNLKEILAVREVETKTNRPNEWFESGCVEDSSELIEMHQILTKFSAIFFAMISKPQISISKAIIYYGRMQLTNRKKYTIFFPTHCLQISTQFYLIWWMPPEQIGFAKIEITVRLTVHFFLLLIIVHEMELNGNLLDILCIITAIVRRTLKFNFRN